MTTLVPTASDAEWLAARRHGVTASEIGTVLGFAPEGWDTSPYKLWHQKAGNLPPDDETDMMERGTLLEPVVAEKFARRHPEFAVCGDGRTLFAHSGRPWQMATPDRILYDAEPVVAEKFALYDAERTSGPGVASLQCKVVRGFDPDKGWGDDGSEDIPLSYRCQVLWECDVMGLPAWYLAALDPAAWKLRVYHGTIGPQERADLKIMREEARCFLDSLDLGEPPDVDWRPATGAALRALHPLIEDREALIPRQMAISYHAAVKRAAAAERRKSEMTHRVLALMGNARTAVDRDGRKVATRSVSEPKRIDTAKLRTEHPDVAAACTKPPKPEIRLTPVKEK